MMPDFTFNELRHQAVDGASASGDLLQNVGAIFLFFQSPNRRGPGSRKCIRERRRAMQRGLKALQVSLGKRPWLHRRHRRRPWSRPPDHPDHSKLLEPPTLKFRQDVKRDAQNETAHPAEELCMAVSLNPGRAGCRRGPVLGNNHEVPYTQKRPREGKEGQTSEDKRGQRSCRLALRRRISRSHLARAIPLVSQPPGFRQVIIIGSDPNHHLPSFSRRRTSGLGKEHHSMELTSISMTLVMASIRQASAGKSPVPLWSATPVIPDPQPPLGEP